MKKYAFVPLIISIAVIAGSVFVFAGCGHKDQASISQAQVMYRCPMHPSFTSDKPGNCAICGMKLVTYERNPSSPQTSTPAFSKEKTLEEVCLTYKCSVKDCPMTIKAHIKPGERLICPVCGEVIAATDGKVVEIPNQRISPAPVAASQHERKPLYYRNPMNPQSTSPVPMKDSMGMDYIPVYSEESTMPSGEGRKVTISPERQQLIGVTTEPVQKRELTKVVRVAGKIAYDPELVVTQEEFVQALRAHDNVQDSPLQDVIDRAKSLADASRNKLKLLGMSDGQIAELEKSRKVETNLYLPDKGEDVWAYINVFEYEIGFIKVGDSVDLEAVAYPGEKFIGKVVSINPVFDPQTRTNQVRVIVPNPDSKLKPEMFVNAVIKEPLGVKLAVPETAVLDTGLRKIVYCALDNNVLESREVTLGQKAGKYYEVLKGLQEGDVVVTSGNFLVDSESKLRSPSQE